MTIAICDDEPAVRDALRERVRRCQPRADVRLYESGEELLAGDLPDILFLDIQMDGISGMDAAKALRKNAKDVVIIFVTAIEEQVFDAFDVGAFHYLVKPFSDGKFEQVLEKAVRQVAQKTAKTDEKRPKQIVVQDGIHQHFVEAGRIVYAEVFNRTVTIHLANGEITYRGSLRDLEAMAGEDFYRPHRSFLVNLKKVTGYSRSEILLADSRVPIGRGHYADFVKAFMRCQVRAL